MSYEDNIKDLERHLERNNGFAKWEALKALSIMKSQKVELEKLKMENEALDDAIYPLPFKTNFDKAIEAAKSDARKEFAEKSEKILIEKYKKYHLIANNTQLKEGVDMFYQGRAEAIWECIDINRNLLAEMDDEEK